MANRHSHQLRNFLAFGSDTVFFSIAFTGFMNPNVILPAFTTRLGGSAESVGLLIAVISLAWSTPQAIAGNIASRFSRQKPFVLAMALSGRMFIFGLVALISLTQANPPWLSLTAIYLALVIFLGTDGFATIGWMDMLARAFPAKKRGSFISIWQAAAAGGVLGVSALVSYLLGEQSAPFPSNYALLFGLAGLFFIGSAIGTLAIYEPSTAGDMPPPHIAWRDFWSHFVKTLRDDERLRQVTLTRMLFTLGTIASPFYVLYATEQLAMDPSLLGTFIGAQTVGIMIAGLTLGRIADRFGAERAIQIGICVVLSAPAMALIISFSDGAISLLLPYLYIWIYVCIGLANNLPFLGFANYILDIAPTNQRTVYSGIVNTINSLAMPTLWVAGWLPEHISYEALFSITLIFCFLALLFALRLPTSRNLVQAHLSRPAENNA